MAKLSLGTLVVDVIANTAAFERDLERADKKIIAFSRRFQKIGERLKSVGAKMSLAVSAPFAIISGYAVKTLSDFDDAMTESTAIMGGVSSKMRKSMESVATTMGEKLAFSADKAARGFYYLFSSGMNANQSLRTMDEVMEFARAGAFDLATATELATDAQASMGLKAQNVAKNEKNLARTTDVLLKATTLADATTEQFATALSNQAGAVARGFGISIEETTALLSAFANQGQKGRRAGTRLAIALEQMVRAAEDNKNVWKKYGVEMFDAQGNIRAMADVVEDLEKTLGPMSAQMRAATMEEMGFQVKSQRVVKMLIGMSDKIREWNAELHRAGGTTERVANDQMESLTKQFNRAWIAVKNLTISFAHEFEPQIRKTVDTIKELADKLRDLPSEKKIKIAVTGAELAAIGPLLYALGVVAGIIANIGKGLARIKYGFVSLLKLAGSLVTPIVIAGGAIVAIVGSVKVLRDQFKWIDKVVGWLADKFEIIGKTLKDWGKYLLNEIALIFKALAKAPGIVFEIMTDEFAKWIEKASQYVANFIIISGKWFIQLVRNWRDNFTNLLDWMKKAWIALNKRNIKISKPTWKAIGSLAVESMSTAFKIIAGEAQDMWEHLQDPTNIKKWLKSLTPINNFVDEVKNLEGKGKKALDKLSDDLDIDPIELKSTIPEPDTIDWDKGISEITKKWKKKIGPLQDKLAAILAGDNKGEEPDWLSQLSDVLKQVTEGFDISNLEKGGDAVKDGAEQLNKAAENVRASFRSARSYWEDAMKAATKPLEKKEKGKTEEEAAKKSAEEKEAFIDKQIKVAEQLGHHLSTLGAIQDIIAKTNIVDVRKVLAEQLNAKFPDVSKKELLDILTWSFPTKLEKRTREWNAALPLNELPQPWSHSTGKAGTKEEKGKKGKPYNIPSGIFEQFPKLLKKVFGWKSGTKTEDKQNTKNNKETADNTKEMLIQLKEINSNIQPGGIFI